VPEDNSQDTTKSSSQEENVPNEEVVPSVDSESSSQEENIPNKEEATSNIASDEK
jgi:hypothetical protein